MQLVTLSLLVDDEPSALGRIFFVLRQRNVQVNSATIASARRPGALRVTLRLNPGEMSSNQVARFLNRIVSVHKLVVIDEAIEVPFELAILVLSVSAEVMIQVLLHLQTGVSLAGRRDGAVIVHVSGTSAFIDEFVAKINPASIREVARSGPVVSGFKEKN